MADLSFYKYLEAAFRHKLYKDTTATSFKYLDYSLPYESIGGKKGIFEYARKILPKFYTSEFPDTKEGNLQMAKKVLEKLERKQDAELVKQFEGYNAAEDGQTIEEAKAQSEAEGQPSAVGEPVGTMAGGIGGFGLPSGGSAISPNPRRIIHIVPPTRPEAESSKIVIANKSGVVAEKAPSTLYVTNKSGVVVEERTITPTSSTTKKPESPSKLYITDKGGRISEERNITPSSTTIKKPEAPPKILIADKSGRIIEKSPVVSRELYIANKSGVVVEKHTVPKASRFNFPSRFKLPTGLINSLKNFGSRLGVFFKRNFGKFLTVGRIATGAGAVIGGFAGAGLTGGASMGVLGGSIGGAILPSWVRSGGAGRFFGKAGNGVINFGARLSNQVGKGGLKLAGPKKKVALLFLGSFLLFGLAAGLLGALNPGGTPTGTGTTTGILPSDISQCKFGREGDGEGNKISYKSPLLLTYIQEASGLTNIPAAVLAAFIRVESPSAVKFTDDKIKNYECNVSPTGALGIMQIQPEGTKGNDRLAISNGAKLIGKTYEELTKDDYCDVKKSIIIGAGFLLTKMTYKTDDYPKTYGNGTKWDDAWTNDKEAIEKLVSGYYGCLKYGSNDDVNNSCKDPRRIHSYGRDVWDSIQSCKVITITTTTTAGSNTTLNMSAPSFIKSKEELIDYKITVTYTGAAKTSLIITDIIPEQAEFVSATGDYKREGKRISWGFSDVSAGQSREVTLKLRSLIDQGTITNVAEAASLPE